MHLLQFSYGRGLELGFAPYEQRCKPKSANTGLALRKLAFSLSDSFEKLAVDTVYFGGGTPSLLDPAHLQAMLDAIRENVFAAIQRK